MTANFSGDETPQEHADDSLPRDPSVEGETVLERENVLKEYQGRFPVIINVFEDYFVTNDKSILFLERYQKQGEARAEFTGLKDEIMDAIRNSRESTPLVNSILRSKLTQQEARSMLSELLDQMLEQGDFSAEAMEAADEEARENRQRPDPDDMFAYYAKRKFAIPVKSLKKFEYPLWMWLAGSAGVLVFGVLLGYIPWPEFLNWFPITFIALGVIGVAFCLIAMLGLRDEILHPDKEERREKEKSEFLDKREDKRKNKDTLADRVRRTLS